LSASGLQHTRNKNQNSVINIPISTSVRIIKRNRSKDQPLIKASHVSFYPSQIKNLEKIAQEEGKATAQVIRETVRRFLNKGTFERNTFNFHVPSARGTKRIYPRFSKSDWDMLNRVSKKTNRHRTELVREAVDEYLR